MRKPTLILIGSFVFVIVLFALVWWQWWRVRDIWIFLLASLDDQKREYNAFVEAAFTANLFTGFFDGVRDRLSNGLANKCSIANQNCLMRIQEYVEAEKSEEERQKIIDERDAVVLQNIKHTHDCKNILNVVAIAAKYVCVLTAILCLPVLLFDLQNKIHGWSAFLALPFIMFIFSAFLIYLFFRWHKIWLSCENIIGLYRDGVKLKNKRNILRGKLSGLKDFMNIQP